MTLMIVKLSTEMEFSKSKIELYWPTTILIVEHSSESWRERKKSRWNEWSSKMKWVVDSRHSNWMKGVVMVKWEEWRLNGDENELAKSYFSCLLLSFTTHKSFIFFHCDAIRSLRSSFICFSSQRLSFSRWLPSTSSMPLISSERNTREKQYQSRVGDKRHRSSIIQSNSLKRCPVQEITRSSFPFVLRPLSLLHCWVYLFSLINFPSSV